MCDRRISEMSELIKLKEDEYSLTLSNLENKYESRIGDHMDRYDKLVRHSVVGVCGRGRECMCVCVCVCLCVSVCVCVCLCVYNIYIYVSVYV